MNGTKLVTVRRVDPFTQPAGSIELDPAAQHPRG